MDEKRVADSSASHLEDYKSEGRAGVGQKPQVLITSYDQAINGVLG